MIRLYVRKLAQTRDIQVRAIMVPRADIVSINDKRF